MSPGALYRPVPHTARLAPIQAKFMRDHEGQGREVYSMSALNNDEQDKVDTYLDVIQNRILAPIQTTDFRQYCTATLLLLFAAIDGLGKLLHQDDKARPTERIRCTLDYMGGGYPACKRQLLDLRHSLVHNAINVESFLSNAEIGAEQHLKRMGTAGFVYVNTSTMVKDFISAFEKFRAEIRHDRAMLKRAANRLEWRAEDSVERQVSPDGVAPSPPPPIEFILAR